MKPRKTEVLQIVDISEVRVSKDDRNYRLVGFIPVDNSGILSNQRIRRRNIWEEGPFNSPGDTIYPMLDKIEEDLMNGRPGAKVYGTIETCAVEEYFIENPMGKFIHPDTGEPANRVDQYTGVVFESETIEQQARSSGLTPLSDRQRRTDITEEIAEELAEGDQEQTSQRTAAAVHGQYASSTSTQGRQGDQDRGNR